MTGAVQLGLLPVIVRGRAGSGFGTLKPEKAVESMADIINLRRARKNKDRATKAAKADTNRRAHGIAKPARDLAKARRDKDARVVDAHRLDHEK
jgi:hypothetical protein